MKENFGQQYLSENYRQFSFSLSENFGKLGDWTGPYRISFLVLSTSDKSYVIMPLDIMPSDIGINMILY